MDFTGSQDPVFMPKERVYPPIYADFGGVTP
jgi:hypothetical protein